MRAAAHPASLRANWYRLLMGFRRCAHDLALHNPGNVEHPRNATQAFHRRWLMGKARQAGIRGACAAFITGCYWPANIPYCQCESFLEGRRMRKNSREKTWRVVAGSLSRPGVLVRTTADDGMQRSFTQ